MPTIRKVRKEDERVLWQIKHDTIRNINIKDYSEQQVQAWAPELFEENKWAKRIRDRNPFIAEINGTIVGYADVQSDGLIDHFFCHSQYQGRGIGKVLMLSIFKEAQAKKISRLYSHVSVTAKPFFEHFGFTVIKKQNVEIRGQVLINFVMQNNLKN